ncbi:MAG: hypothetical protein SCH70_13655 [Candidatus Methanoperedens sp.]|nr:hypothetical protein [Candidatus Methanoperedens sp.]
MSALRKLRVWLGWCPNGTVVKSKSKIQLETSEAGNIMRAAPASIDSLVVWLSRIFGMLNLPIAFVAIIDGSIIFTLLNPSYIPQTTEQWIGFLTAITVFSGAVAGLTIKHRHSPNRKMAHLLISMFGLFLTFDELIRLIKTVLFAG